MVLADTSALFALVVENDANHVRAAECAQRLSADKEEAWTTTHLVHELWMLVFARFGLAKADEVVRGVLATVPTITQVEAGDLGRALAVTADFPDQDFSLADRLSFVLLERLGRKRVWTYDSDFAIYRFGPDRTEAFTIIQ